MPSARACCTVCTSAVGMGQDHQRLRPIRDHVLDGGDLGGVVAVGGIDLELTDERRDPAIRRLWPVRSSGCARHCRWELESAMLLQVGQLLVLHRSAPANGW